MLPYNPPQDANEVIAIVVRGLYKQNWRRCANEFGQCIYRHGDLKCAAGQLLPDSHWHLSINRATWKELVTQKIVTNSNFLLIGGLQIIHDEFNEPTMALRFYDYVISNGFKWPSDVPIPEEVVK